MKLSAVILVSAASALMGQCDSLPADTLDTLPVVEAIIEQAVSYLGVPYVWGGSDENGFDCSGLTYRVFNDNGIPLPRTVTAIEEMGEYVERDSMLPGDIMIFHDPTHTGIYIGNGEFIHCSSWQDRGVVITSIDHSNYLRRYHASVRVVGN
jgi:cell wall-associated NlpC family hydrolase